jgi:hypothetical protein
MEKVKSISIALDLNGLPISVGLDHRNLIIKKAEEKLKTDNNGEFLGAGYMDGVGDIDFTEIKDFDKAERRIAEVIEELSFQDIFLGMHCHFFVQDN